MIDLDQLLFGVCTHEEVVEFFRDGSFDSEYYLVGAIKRHLLTPEQSETLAKHGVSIEDCLNGRVEGDRFPKDSLYSEWNTKLGFRCFG